jgi:K+ transporter
LASIATAAQEEGGVATAPPAAADFPPADAGHSSNLRALTLAALGVVYGDIGTSPLYTLR